MKIVQENNWKINNILAQLTEKQQFRIFKTDLQAKCNQFESGRIELCSNPKCSVRQCDMRDVPQEILDTEQRHADCKAAGKVDRSLAAADASTLNQSNADWLDFDEDDLVWIDYALNPSGWTGQTGNTANNLWLEVHTLCAETEDAACTEDDLLRRLISGMHSNTNMHIAANQPLEYDPFTGEISRYGLNKDLQLQFFPNHEWIENMYFTQIFLLKSIGTIRDQLNSEACTICPQDAETRNLLHAVTHNDLLQSCTENIFDRKVFFQSEQALGLVAKLKSKFKKISRIINCTECEKCRLHAKQELLAIGTALKIDFDLVRNFENISRNELVALVNTAKKFSDSIQNQWIINENLKNEYNYSIQKFNNSAKQRVLIIGSGLAGLSAAYTLARSKKVEVMIVDKNNVQGGNSAKATSGINGVATSTQRELSEPDSVDRFVADTMQSNTFAENEPLVRQMAEHSAEAVETLKQLGVRLDKILRLGGHSASRTHRIHEGPVGFTIVNALHEQLKSKINIIKMTAAKKIIRIKGDNDSEYENVKASDNNYKISFTNKFKNPQFKTQIESKYIDSNSSSVILSDFVILATGGFSASKSKLEKYSPQQKDQPTTNGSFANGDGLDLGEQIGGVTKQIEQVQIHPTGFVDPFDKHNIVKWLAPEALRGVGGILVNSEGERFCNELGARDQVTARIEEQKNKEVFIVLNDRAVEEFGPNFKFQHKVRKFFTKFENQIEFAEQYGMDAETFKHTIEDQGQNIKMKSKDAFGKDHFATKFKLFEPFQAALVVPVIHYTMGGLKINSKGNLLDKDDNEISNAQAIGEVSGGIHGKNRLAGNSLLECMVQGQIAAENIIKVVKDIYDYQKIDL